MFLHQVLVILLIKKILSSLENSLSFHLTNKNNGYKMRKHHEKDFSLYLELK